LNEGMIETKGKMDFVTDVDKQSEKQLLDGLALILPEAGFIAEEGTYTQRGKKFNWIVDPLDGTTNFIHGVFPFSVSIALMEDEELVAGVIYDPLQDECFSAWKGGPARLNGKTIHTSQRASLSEALVATGFPYTDFSLIDPYMASLKDIMGCTHGIRRLGSAAMDLAYVACGRYDAFWEYHLKPWDVAAGTLIIRQAGGQVNDFHGGDNYLFGETYVASNGLIHKEFLDLLKKYF
ncbi:MAG: inositol monophosphatase family protein, partial [Bacteroidales bacterium]|nr:inositol monophosphatase family protein [Bacteroidales bacterium]